MGRRFNVGLFRDLGRRAERLKRQVEDAAEERHTCGDCGETFSAGYDVCPECGSEDVSAVE